MTDNRTGREAHIRELADKMMFSVEESGGRFTFTRTADLSKPERSEPLSIDEAEEYLNTWKLRGFHGG
jgi:hypothetical protein